jgi:regulator of sigma D
MTKKTKEFWPKVEIGTHLAVIQYEDGTYEMYWDDDKLLEEVREAIASVEKNGQRKH